MKWLLPILFLLLGVTLRAQEIRDKNSYFEANCLNILTGKDNSLLEINFNPQLFHIELASGNAVANLEIQIGVRKRNTRGFILTRHFSERIEHRFLDAENVFFRRYSFTLPEGAYTVEIQVTDKKDGTLHFESLDYECKDLRKGYQLSDIVLEQDFLGALGAQTLLTGKISPHPGNLRYWLDIYAPGNTPLTCRAVLYKKAGKELENVSRFSSANQQVSILKPTSGQIRYGDTISLDGLESGEYLLEIYLELDRKMVAEESRAFTVEWKKAGRVFGDLDHSIEMMKYIATPSEIATILKSPSQEEKIDRFQRFWEQLSMKPGGYPTQSMEEYFERAFYAQDFLKEQETEGWLTDRGKTYIVYGTPAKQEEKTNNGKHFLIWDYTQPQLRFVFEENNGRWKTVTP